MSQCWGESGGWVDSVSCIFYIVLRGSHNLFDKENGCEEREKELEEAGRASKWYNLTSECRTHGGKLWPGQWGVLKPKLSITGILNLLKME